MSKVRLLTLDLNYVLILKQNARLIEGQISNFRDKKTLDKYSKINCFWPDIYLHLEILNCIHGNTRISSIYS